MNPKIDIKKKKDAQEQSKCAICRAVTHTTIEHYNDVMRNREMTRK